jgi:DNA recombination protein RmuC
LITKPQFMETLLFIALVALQLVAIVLVIVFRNKGGSDLPELQARVGELQTILSKIETNLKEDFRINRDENTATAKANREELNKAIVDFRGEIMTAVKSMTEQNNRALEKLNQTLEQKVSALIEKNERSFKAFTDGNTTQLEKFEKKVEENLKALNEQAKADNNLMREALLSAFKGFEETFDKNVKSFNDLQKEKFELMENKQNDLVKGTETKLDIIRATVEEKLEKTLSERLGQSFETVGKQLIEVQKGLGEMQTLAQDVGGLKKVLSNVKMRGGIGEVQLAMLLEQILAPDQYEANVKTKSGSSDLVEFAIKLPGRDTHQKQVWIPIDAKFPKDVFEQLQTAYETGDIAQIEVSQRNLENTIKKMARDISDKYVDPPCTTDFGIMFLPFEGIYAEVVRKASLLEDLQRNYKIIVTGPTTLAAILNSLQMGFRTLAIQKRSSEVWQVLAAVKKEFDNFGGLMQKAQKNIQTGLDQLDDVMGRRTKAIQRKLRGVESLDESEAKLILPELTDAELLDEENAKE